MSKASLSKKNVLVKYDTANIGVVHMESFKAEKAYLAM
jgi:hypothetical protein